MSEPTGCCCACPSTSSAYCGRCDLLVGLPGLHVTGVTKSDKGVLTVAVESARSVMGCPTCGVIATSHGRRTVTLVDVPCFGCPTRIRWHKRTWRCLEPSCPMRVFTEHDDRVGRRRGLLTRRARLWCVEQLAGEHASILGLARQLGVAWKTVWGSIQPILTASATDESRFVGVTTLGVDEHVWHHVDTRVRGPKEFTGMVDLSRDKHGHVHARLLDLVPGRSGTVYKTWLDERGEPFKKTVQIATLDPFHGYKNAIDDKLADATAVLDAFHVVALGTRVVDKVRRRVQQELHGHRGRAGDPLYGIRNVLRCGSERLTTKQWFRLLAAIDADERHEPVWVAWNCAQELRDAYRHPDPAEGRKIAERIIASLPSCPIPEVARLGRTLKQWKTAFLAYFTTGRASNGGSEAINGLIELHRRIARGFRNPDNYRLRMLLIAGGLAVPPPQV